MHFTICVWAGDHFGLRLTLIDPLLKNVRKTILTFAFPVTSISDLYNSILLQ